jgi:hypothetical protein
MDHLSFFKYDTVSAPSYNDDALTTECYLMSVQTNDGQ